MAPGILVRSNDLFHKVIKEFRIGLNNYPIFSSHRIYIQILVNGFMTAVYY